MQCEYSDIQYQLKDGEQLDPRVLLPLDHEWRAKPIPADITEEQVCEGAKKRIGKIEELLIREYVLANFDEYIESLEWEIDRTNNSVDAKVEIKKFTTVTIIDQNEQKQEAIKADISYWIFKDLNCFDYIFSDFCAEGAEFHGKYTIFYNVQFHGRETSFSCAQFHDTYTLFDEAKFKGERTSFNGAEFHGERALFDRTQFNGAETSFDNISIADKACILFQGIEQNSKHSSEIHLKNLKLEHRNNIRFENDKDSQIPFEEYPTVHIDSCDILEPECLRLVNVPIDKFKFTQNTLKDVKWDFTNQHIVKRWGTDIIALRSDEDKVTFNIQNPQSRADTYLIMKDYAKYHNDTWMESCFHFWYLYWTNRTIQPPQRYFTINHIYQLVSDYGMNWHKPLLCFMVVGGIFAIFYQSTLNLEDPWINNLILSLHGSIAFWGTDTGIQDILQTKIHELNNHSSYRVLIFNGLFTVQKIVQTFLLIQFGLAIRSRIKK